MRKISDCNERENKKTPYEAPELYIHNPLDSVQAWEDNSSELPF